VVGIGHFKTDVDDHPKALMDSGKATEWLAFRCKR